MKNKYVDEYDVPSPRNPHVKDLYNGTHKPTRHDPKPVKKERFKPDYEALVDEEEHLLDESKEETADEAEQNWRDYLASQNIATEGGTVTPKNESN